MQEPYVWGGLLGGQNLLGVGPAQADELLRQDLGEPRDQGAFDDQPGYGGLAGLVRRADILRRVLDLLVEKQGNVAEFLGILLIDGPDVLLGDVRRDDLLHVADADALLHGQDHDEIGDVDPEVFPLYRGGHDLQPHIVVDGGGGDKAFLAAGHGRDEVQILGQQHHHLVHIQPQIGDGVPLRQVVVGDEPVPPVQLVGDQLFVILHTAFLRRFLFLYNIRIFGWAQAEIGK